jgi:hypothetical protein
MGDFLLDQELAPVLLFVYNRPIHTLKTLQALAANPGADRTDLIVYSDGPKNISETPKVEETRDLVSAFFGFKSVQIVARETNLGLADSIITGVSEVLEEYENVIVLEDDLITAPGFLTYMNKGLNFYKDEMKVVSIHAYAPETKESLPDTYFLKGADCLGWATWRRGWKHFNPNGSELLKDLYDKKLSYQFNFSGTYGFTRMLEDQIDGKNQSWAIRWYASTFLLNLLTLHPGTSFISHIGNDGSGTHSPNKPDLTVKLRSPNPNIELIKVCESAPARKIHEQYYLSLHSLLGRLWITTQRLLISRK